MSNSALISPDSPDDHNLVAVIDGDISNDLGRPCRPESHALPAISSLISDFNTFGSAFPLVILITCLTKKPNDRNASAMVAPCQEDLQTNYYARFVRCQPVSDSPSRWMDHTY